VTILQDVRRLNAPGFEASTYRSSFEGDHASAGFVDFYPRDGSGLSGGVRFFDQRNAYECALAIHRAASAAGASCMILYNDWLVAREVQPDTGHAPDERRRQCELREPARRRSTSAGEPKVSLLFLSRLAVQLPLFLTNASAGAFWAAA
jgi:hypothetical protein